MIPPEKNENPPASEQYEALIEWITGGIDGMHQKFDALEHRMFKLENGLMS